MSVNLFLFQLFDDFDELVAESDGVALRDIDDAVEAVGNDEDGEGGGGEMEGGDELVADGAVDVAAPDGGEGEHGGGRLRKLFKIEALGGGGAVEEEHEGTAPLVEAFRHTGDVTQGVVRGLVAGSDEAEDVVAATGGGEEGEGR